MKDYIAIIELLPVNRVAELMAESCEQPCRPDSGGEVVDLDATAMLMVVFC